MLPTPGDVHVSRALSNVAVAYWQQGGSVFDKVFPVVPVAKQADSYFVFSRDDLTRIEARERAPGSPAAMGEFRITTGTYSARIYAMAKAIPDEVRENADEAIDPERSAVNYCTGQVRMKAESVWGAAHFGSGKGWTDLVAGTDFTAWDQAGSDPVLDIMTQSDAVARKTGFRPNKLVLGAEVGTVCLNHPAVLARMGVNGPRIPTVDDLARIFRVGQVFIGDMMNTTTAEGAASATQAFILGKHALLVYAAPAPSVDLPSGGYTFAWNRKGGTNGMRTYRMREDTRHSDIVEVDMAFDAKLVAGSLGVMFPSAVS